MAEARAVADYTIRRYQNGQFGIRVDSERAAKRPHHLDVKGATTGFKNGYEAAEFVRFGEAEGYSAGVPLSPEETKKLTPFCAKWES